MYYFKEGTNVEAPKTRLFYLHINERSEKLPTGKSSVTLFSFKMNYFDQNFELSLSQTSRQAGRRSVESEQPCLDAGSIRIPRFLS